MKVYSRVRAGGRYYYGDFRGYADVGGKLEALAAPGAASATADFAEAVRLYAAREQAYREARDRRARGEAPEAEAPEAETPRVPRLGPFLRDHLVWKGTQPHVRRGTVARDEKSAKVLLRVLGNVPLPDVTPERLEAYVAQRLAEPGVKRGQLTSARTVRAELHTLSHAMRRAKMRGFVAENPVKLMMAKPPLPPTEAVFLSDAEAARLLAATAAEDADTAALLDARRDAGASGPGPAAPRLAPRGDAEAGEPRVPSPDDQVPFAHPIAATYLYTGGRAEEVLGLLARDVDFARGRVRFKHNVWRRLKREHHERSVQLWPALAEVLRAHVAATGVSGDQLLFPSPATGGMLYRFGKPLDRCVARAGIAGKRVTPHTLRHTFTTALLQTLVPVAGGGWAVRSSFDVAKQLGHKSSKLVDDTYGHAVEDPVYRRELRYGAAGPTSA